MADRFPLSPAGSGSITIVELSRGFRIDVVACHTASGEVRRLPPTHLPTLALARKFAAEMHKISGDPIEEHLKAKRA